MKPESGRSEVIGWIICLSRGTTSPHWFHPTTIRSLITTRCAYRIRSQSAEKTKAAANIHNFIKMGTQESSFSPKKTAKNPKMVNWDFCKTPLEWMGAAADPQKFSHRQSC